MTKINWFRFAFVALCLLLSVFTAFYLFLLPLIKFAQEQPRVLVNIGLIALLTWGFVKMVKVIREW